MNWFESKRIDWIWEMLRIYGFINKSHLMFKFHISECQASKDLTKASKLYSHMKYNVNRKRYELSED